MQDLWNENGIADLVSTYKLSRNRLILLDFDGTLVDFAPNPVDAVPSKDLSDKLFMLANKPNSKLVIITGRRKSDIDQKVGHLPIDIVAEHGAMIKENFTWKTLLDGFVDWKKEVYPIFIRFTSHTPHSMMEEKNHSLAWHYRNVEQETGYIQSRALIESLKEVASCFGLKIIDGNGIVEIIDKKINKGLATNYLVAKDRYDYILSMGDDKTDEDMFEALLINDKAYTVKIGNGNSFAKYKLHNVQQVNMLLKQLL